MSEREASSGPRIPGYALVRELGRGGMGVVYLAHQTSLDRQVAVKVLGAGVLDDVSALKRLRKEGQLMKGLAHPNIVRLLDYSLDDPTPFLVFEHVPGETSIETVLDRGGDTLAVTIPMLLGITRALEHLHSRGLLHRDLKPANILLAPDGEPRLIDFGLALRVGADETRQTQAGHVVGTLSYMAPEQMDGRDATGASDVYAWGLIAYELLCRRLVFSVHATDPKVTATDRYIKPVPPVAPLAPTAPTALVDLVMRCLERDPARRPTAADLVAALEAGGWKESSSRASRPAASLPRQPSDRTAVSAPPFAAVGAPHAIARPQTSPAASSSATLRTRFGLAAAAVVLAGVSVGGLIHRPAPPVQQSEGTAASTSGSQLGPAGSTVMSLPVVTFEARGDVLVAHIATTNAQEAKVVWTTAQGRREETLVRATSHEVKVDGPTVSDVREVTVDLEDSGPVDLDSAFGREVGGVERTLSGVDVARLKRAMIRGLRSPDADPLDVPEVRGIVGPDLRRTVARDALMMRQWIVAGRDPSLRATILQHIYDLEAVNAVSRALGARPVADVSACLPSEWRETLFEARQGVSPVREPKPAGAIDAAPHAKLDDKAMPAGDFDSACLFQTCCAVAEFAGNAASSSLDQALGIGPVSGPGPKYLWRIELEVPSGTVAVAKTATLGIYMSDPGGNALWVDINGRLRVPFTQAVNDPRGDDFTHRDHVRTVPTDVLTAGMNRFTCRLLPSEASRNKPVMFLGSIHLAVRRCDQPGPAGE